jgi:hypothetical protein
MDRAYPQLFSSKYGVIDDGLWFNILKHLTRKELKLGLERMVAPGTKYHEYPPSPMAFRELCQPFNERTHHDAYRDNPLLKALPAPRNLELAAKCMREIRFKLGLLK